MSSSGCQPVPEPRVQVQGWRVEQRRETADPDVTLALLLASCVTMAKPLPLAGPQFQAISKTPFSSERCLLLTLLGKGSGVG